ncbi:GAG-pre-integrase domain-containing protein [Aspergillus affinis]|uniref:GAG-pre-integrase domain-containing protein n=1 Tax=Aspergillus affinis TaxID=1070780 RepID=UPI0022FE8DDC|nr:uncharacterized protein KD926_003520 [Aspergillus affinis]KAI9035424.1 hypothetical protein KD926_003520 [Aspergillus affinis]
MPAASDILLDGARSMLDFSEPVLSKVPATQDPCPVETDHLDRIHPGMREIDLPEAVPDTKEMETSRLSCVPCVTVPTPEQANNTLCNQSAVGDSEQESAKQKLSITGPFYSDSMHPGDSEMDTEPSQTSGLATKAYNKYDTLNTKIMQYIADSIPSRYFYLISNKSSAYDQIVALQGRFKPSTYEEQSYCLRAYEKVCHGPKRSQDIKKWIEDFEAVAGSLQDLTILNHTFLSASARQNTVFMTAPTDKVKRRSEMQRISTASVERWHQRMGHLHDEAIHHLHEAVEGVEISFKSRDPHCETCLLAKPIRQISRRPVERSPDAWDKVHFDLIKVSSAYNGNQWIDNFMDNVTGWRKIYTAPNKNALVPEIKSLVKWIKTYFNKIPKTFVCDNEQTLGREFILFCKDKRITILHSVRYTPEQNGFIERGGRIITLRLRNLMINSRLPVDL